MSIFEDQVSEWANEVDWAWIILLALGLFLLIHFIRRSR